METPKPAFKSLFSLPEIEKLAQTQSKTLTVTQFRKLTDSDVFSISKLIERNLEFLEEIIISNQIISGKSLAFLAKAIQENTFITTLNLSNNVILGDLTEITSSIRASGIKHLDLSKCQLTDSHIPHILSLIKYSSLSVLNLESNNFKSLNMYQELVGNPFIEELNLSYNQLGVNEVLAVIDALAVNKSLKILGIQGYNNILFDQKLAEVLKGSFLIVLKYDLDIIESKVLKQLEKSLLGSNKCLVSIESKGVDWESISAKHPLLEIKKALKANLWLSQNDMLPSEANDDIFLDVEDLIRKKLEIGTRENSKLDEDQVIANEYEKIPEITHKDIKEVLENKELNKTDARKLDKSPLSRRDLPKFEVKEKYKFPDMSAEEKQNPFPEPKSNSQFLSNNRSHEDSLEKLDEKFEKILDKVTEKISKLEEKIDLQQGDIESLQSIISSKLNKLTEKIETEITAFTLKHNSVSGKLEEKIIQIENKDERKTIFLKEIAEQYEITQEALKDLDSRIDELKHFIKIKPPKPEPKPVLPVVDYKPDIEDIQEKISNFSESFLKISVFEEMLRKNSQRTENLRTECFNFQTEISQNLLLLEEKVSETFKLKPQMSTLQKELFSKLTSLDCKILEISDNPLIQDLSYRVESIDSRLVSLEEKLTKSICESNYSIKHRDQLIESRLAYLEQERLNIEELKSRIMSRTEDSFMDRDKSLDERISNLEKMNSSKRSFGIR